MMPMKTPMGESRIPPAENLRLLMARMEDLGTRAARGEMAVSSFLTPREAKYAEHQLAARLAAGTAVLWGGYPEAERRRAVFLPDYTEGMLTPEALAADPVAALVAVGLTDLADALRMYAVVLTVRGSGYRELTHRDYLGSVLGLGLERDAVGDILVTEAYAAEIITDARMGEFLCAQLVKVATDTVRVGYRPSDTPLRAVHRLMPITDTVASERLDCVVAALCNLSREKAQEAVRGGLVEVDYDVCEVCDAPLAVPCVLSVRGVGKFAVQGFDGTTKKGRLRLLAGKYL